MKQKLSALHDQLWIWAGKSRAKLRGVRRLVVLLLVPNQWD